MKLAPISGMFINGRTLVTILPGHWALALLVIASCCSTLTAEEIKRKPQYQHEDIVVAGAWEGEPTLEIPSVEKALAYLDNGATAWSRNRKCVSCHTTGSYLRMRPLLTSSVGKPSDELHTFFVSQMKQYEEKASIDVAPLTRGSTAAGIVYIAMGLAEWDAQVAGRLSDETRRAMDLMFAVQGDSGSWANDECWPPLESSSYQTTTVAAMAVATAPGWRDNVGADKHGEALAKVKAWLTATRPPHDYGKVLLLWASTRWAELLDEAQSQRMVDEILNLQNEDGGWSIRRFAQPGEWGNGSRAEKLRSEPDTESPPSDAHMTGLVLIALLDAGVAHDDGRIQNGIAWLQKNQRESGRWWTRSLNTNTYHFITFSSTLYALVALDKSGALMP